MTAIILWTMINGSSPLALHIPFDSVAKCESAAAVLHETLGHYSSKSIETACRPEADGPPTPTKTGEGA